MPRNGKNVALVWLGGADETTEEFPRFHIFPYLLTGSMHAIIGPYKEGKSFAALEVAIALAYHKPFLGRHPVDVGGKVLYIAGEGAFETRMRFRAAMQARGLTGEPRIAIWEEPFDFKDERTCRPRLMHEISAHGFDMVIVDTASRCGAGDESSVDMPMFVEGLTEVQRTMRVTVLLIHHTPDYDRNKPRGHTSLPAAIDGQWIMHKEKATGLFKLREGFSRWSAGGGDIAAFRVEPYPLGKNADGRVIAPGLVVTGSATDRQLQVLAALQAGKGYREIATELECAPSTIQSEIAALKALGLWEGRKSGPRSCSS